MAVLAVSRYMLSRYGKLEKPIQNKISEIAGEFQRLSAQELRQSKGIHLERYTGQRDDRARTIRITDNFRGIVCDTGNDEKYILYDVVPHDEADRWMARSEFRVNVAIGAVETLDLEAIEVEIDKVPEPDPGATRLFEHRKDKDFTQLGIGDFLLPTLRAFTAQDELQGLLLVLPQTQANTLIMLTGDDPLEVVYREIAGEFEAGSIAEDDLAAALDTPASKAMFRIVADDAELQDMLARPFAQWRTFLHTSQRDVAYRQVFNGPARVTGGAGTGKTVVAVHRARFLADQLDDRSGKPILFTTFTRNLAEAIERDLRELGGTDLLDVIDVVNVDQLANRLAREAEGDTVRMITGQQLDEAWETVVDEIGSPHSPQFLSNEWEQVILAQNCASRDDYFAANRAGRGIRLNRRGRAEVWKAVEHFTQHLAERNQRTFLQVCDTVAGHLGRAIIKPYRHVIVDEAQDLHEAQWRMLRASVDEDPNDLFIVGDSHQRIYDRRSSLSKVGINIRGRSRRLRINYRTTHEILRWALRVLGEGPFDDLDDGPDQHDYAGYHSFVHGPEPTAIGFATRSAQFEGVANQITEWVNGGVDPDDVGIAVRSTWELRGLATALERAGLQVWELKRDLPTGDGVRIGTMHRMKGLEFRCMAVAGVDDESMPLRQSLTDPGADEIQYRLDLAQERCLLYVACTRAREDLWVGWSGTPSRFLGAVLE